MKLKDHPLEPSITQVNHQDYITQENLKKKVLLQKLLNL